MAKSSNIAETPLDDWIFAPDHALLIGERPGGVHLRVRDRDHLGSRSVEQVRGQALDRRARVRRMGEVIHLGPERFARLGHVRGRDGHGAGPRLREEIAA